MVEARATFLGTGNFLTPGERYWNSFVVECGTELTWLVEPSPTALPNLRRAGFDAAMLDGIVISHFHPDHTFGWPFLLLEMATSGRDPARPVHVVGPPGVQEFLAAMMSLAAVDDITSTAHERLDLRYVEVDESLQSAGNLAFRAVEVAHAPQLRCFGYIFELGGRRIGYSGDTRPCEGLDELAGACESLVVECNGSHRQATHMDVASVRELAQRNPGLRLVTTHLGADVCEEMLPGITMPSDFDQISL